MIFVNDSLSPVGLQSDFHLAKLQVSDYSHQNKKRVLSSRDDQLYLSTYLKHYLSPLKSLGFLSSASRKQASAQSRLNDNRALYLPLSPVGLQSDFFITALRGFNVEQKLVV